MTPPVPGTEKIAARTLDILYRNDCNVLKINKAILPPSHASSEDVKLLINILNPKYIVPVIGEYRHQFALRDVCNQLGYENKDVVMLDNGVVMQIQKGNLVPYNELITNGDFLVDGSLENDVSDVVLRDREMLSTDGVLLIIANVDARNRKIVSTPEIVSRGFVYMKENDELIEQVHEVFNEVTKKVFTHKYIDWRVYKENVKSDLQKFLYKSTKRRPIIIPVLIDTQLK